MKARLKSAASATGQVFGALTVPALSAVSMWRNDTGIQNARNISGDDPGKDVAKDDFSATASWVSVVGTGASLIMSTAFAIENWDKLSRLEKSTVALSIVVAAGGCGYSYGRFGVEHNTFYVGLAGLLGTTVFGLANLGISFFGSMKKAEYNPIHADQRDVEKTQNNDERSSYDSHDDEKEKLDF